MKRFDSVCDGRAELFSAAAGPELTLPPSSGVPASPGCLYAMFLSAARRFLTVVQQQLWRGDLHRVEIRAACQCGREVPHGFIAESFQWSMHSQSTED